MGATLYLKGFTSFMALLSYSNASQPWLKPKHTFIFLMEGWDNSIGYSFLTKNTIQISLLRL